MTSISQPVLPPQAPSNLSQTAAQAHLPPGSISGKTTPQTGATATPPATATARSYASVSKKQISPTSTSNTSSSPVGVGGSSTHHGKTDSVNSKGFIPPAVPVLGPPTIVNGNPTVSPISGPGNHIRKPSVTISAAGASGHMPNGGPVAGKPTGGNNIQFGQINAGGSPAIVNSAHLHGQSPNSLAVQNPSDPRITSPQTSPSPIPQPPASGGRPPSSLQGQGNGLNFGSLGGEERQMKPSSIPQGPLAPGPQVGHLRRESSQSTHSDMGNPAMGPGSGRGGYVPQPPPPQQPQPGRNRAYGPPYQQHLSYSPATNFRPPPNQPRGPGMNAPFQSQQGRLAPYQTPHPGARSPNLTNSQPVHPQPGQVPMVNSQMFQHPYGGYPPNMVPQNQYGMQPGFDPNQAAAYYHQYGPMYTSSMQFMPPSSPRPPHQMPQPPPQQQYTPGQYNTPPQPQQMSRDPSAMSASDRPGSSLGKSQTPSIIPAVNPISRQTISPAPKTIDFKIPQRKGAGIQIKDPSSGAVMNFDKQPPSPAPTRRSPAILSSTPTPPPRTPNDSSHQRTDSKAVKSYEEKKNDMREAIAKKIEAEKAEEKRLKLEAELKAVEDEKAADAKILKEKEEAEIKRLEAAKAQLEAEEAAKREKAEAEEAEQAAAKAREEAEKARKEKEEEEEFARLEAEYERLEKEAEEKYQKKKQAEKEEKARLEAEAAARADEDLKRAEREMEEAEDARLKKLEESEGEDSQKERVNLFAALKKDGPATPSSDTPAVVETPVESGTATPASDTSMAPPLRSTTSGKQKPAALKLETSKTIEPAQPSAQLLSLRSARRLTSITDVSYPAPVASPNPALNTAAPNGKFRYDKEFLLQFQRAFVEKPSENWTDRIKETLGDTTEPASARATSARGAPPMSARQPSNRTAQPVMGTFGAPGGRTLPSGTTSQARYQASTIGLPTPPRPSMQNPLANLVRPGGFPVGMSKPMERTSSSTSLATHLSSPRGNPSQRGGAMRGSRSGRPVRGDDKLSKEMPLTAGKDLKPIEVSAAGWKPRSVGANATGIAGPAPGGDGHMAPDVVQRKVKSNLNKMTPNNFDKISDQILAIAGQSKDETDGRTLRQVIQLTFEKATDEAHWAQMYAEFCKRMLESMSPEIKDVSILDKKDNVVVGGALFRKYLLTRCQEEFERGWKTNLPQKPDGESEEVTMLSDEYYIAAAAKRRGLGLVRFIGELYKLGMLTERIMHECVKKLVDYEGTPDEAEVESLTSLLKTIGQNLDSTQRGLDLMDAYFKRIETMIKTPGLPSRLSFMLMDIVDLRKKGWHGKAGAIKGPTTLDEVRAQTVAAEREKEVQRMQDAGSRRGGGGGGSGRMPVGRGDARNFSGGQYGMMPPPDYNKNTVGMEDLRRLGSRGGSRQVSSQGSTVFGPTSMFGGARGSNTRKTLGSSGIGKGGEDSGASSRTGTPPAQKEKKEKEEKEAAKHANAFSALAGLTDASGEPGSPPSATSSPPNVKAKPSERHRSKSPPKSDDKADGNAGAAL